MEPKTTLIKFDWSLSFHFLFYTTFQKWLITVLTLIKHFYSAATDIKGHILSIATLSLVGVAVVSFEEAWWAPTVRGHICSVWILIWLNNRQLWKLQNGDISPRIDYNTANNLHAWAHVHIHHDIAINRAPASAAFVSDPPPPLTPSEWLAQNVGVGPKRER